ncbi:MAG: carbohydrate ABC transporter permease [Acholeplasmataceae bacterium]|nr:MAG: carbohydrate ABC transporter permease [Acholeplasmataceae bacterium]
MQNKLFSKPFINKTRRLFWGLRFNDGLIFKTLIYTLLIGIGFVYVYPLLHMLTVSFKDLGDLLSPTVFYLPTKFYTENFRQSFLVLRYFPTLMTSLSVTLLPAVMQTIVASFIGYGFARFRFPLKKTLFAIVLITYIIPPQIVMIPRFVLFNNLGLLNSIWAIIIPASFGQGLNSAIFILIFYQFYKMIPKSLDEAAQMDGANHLYIYFKIAIPLSIPSFVTSFLFSFVWYWNETYLSSLFLGTSVQTLQLRLLIFVSAYQDLFPGQAAMINEGIRMAATLLIILPMLIMYFILQRLFIEGIDRAGITGE